MRFFGTHVLHRNTVRPSGQAATGSFSLTSRSGSIRVCSILSTTAAGMSHLPLSLPVLGLGLAQNVVDRGATAVPPDRKVRNGVKGFAYCRALTFDCSDHGRNRETEDVSEFGDGEFVRLL